MGTSEFTLAGMDLGTEVHKKLNYPHDYAIIYILVAAYIRTCV